MWTENVVQPIYFLILYSINIQFPFFSFFSEKSEVPMDYGVSRRHTAVERFNEVCREVLTEPERRGLYKLLNDYYKRRRVERLIPGLFKVIREENRMEVIHVLRRLVPVAHLQEFDRQTRQRQARGQLKTFFWEEEDDGIGTTVSFSSGMVHFKQENFDNLPHLNSTKKKKRNFKKICSTNYPFHPTVAFC